MIIPIDNEKVGLVSARTSFLLDGQYWEGYGVNELKREKVEVTTYSEITKKYVEDGMIDFFILDVEGFELSAIKGMSGSNNLPSHIFVETDKVALSEVAQLLREFDKYKYICSFRGNSVFSRLNVSIHNKIRMLTFVFLKDTLPSKLKSILRKYLSMRVIKILKNFV